MDVTRVLEIRNLLEVAHEAHGLGLAHVEHVPLALVALGCQRLSHAHDSFDGGEGHFAARHDAAAACATVTVSRRGQLNIEKVLVVLDSGWEKEAAVALDEHLNKAAVAIEFHGLRHLVAEAGDHGGDLGVEDVARLERDAVDRWRIEADVGAALREHRLEDAAVVDAEAGVERDAAGAAAEARNATSVSSGNTGDGSAGATFVDISPSGLPVVLGKRQYRLDDFFEVEGDFYENDEVAWGWGQLRQVNVAQL